MDNLNLNLKDLKLSKEDSRDIRKNIFACLFSVHNTISLSRIIQEI